MSLFQMVSELYKMLEDGEIIDSEEIDHLDSTFDASRFIKNMYEHLSENDDDAIDELSERQIATINQLYEGFCNGDWQPLESYL